jgi:hypothetical protein
VAVGRSLLQQTLPRIERARSRGTPVFEYVVTCAGHFLLDLDARPRPPVFAGDSWPVKVANAAHYNSAAVADFVEAIEAKDPDAIVVMYSDHLRPLAMVDDPYAMGGYRITAPRRPAFWERRATTALDRYATPLVVRRSRQTVPVGIVPHFALPEVILDLATDGAYCRATSCITAAPLVYRPIGRLDLFTTSVHFPETLCDTAGVPPDDRCTAARQLSTRLFASYLALFHDGVQPQAPE